MYDIADDSPSVEQLVALSRGDEDADELGDELTFWLSGTHVRKTMEVERYKAEAEPVIDKYRA